MLTKEQLDRYRKLAKEYPEGNIADLISHMDEMVSTWEQICETLVVIHRAMVAFRQSQIITTQVFEVIVNIKRNLQHEGYEKTGQK